MNCSEQHEQVYVEDAEVWAWYCELPSAGVCANHFCQNCPTCFPIIAIPDIQVSVQMQVGAIRTATWLYQAIFIFESSCGFYAVSNVQP